MREREIERERQRLCQKSDCEKNSKILTSSFSCNTNKSYLFSHTQNLSLTTRNSNCCLQVHIAGWGSLITGLSPPFQCTVRILNGMFPYKVLNIAHAVCHVTGSTQSLVHSSSQMTI